MSCPRAVIGPTLAGFRTAFFPAALLYLFLAVLLTLIIGGGPARAQNSVQPVTIRVGGAYAGWGIPDRNATSPSDRARRAVFDAFSRKYPYIKLERYSSIAIQGPAAESGILMAYAGGTAPDIVYVNFRLLRNYVGQGFLRPLNDLLAQDPDTLKRVQPAIRNEIFVDGKLYSVPSGQYVQALYYRKDLFRAAGLDPNKPPANWDEFYAVCQALTDQEKGQWGFAFEQGTESYFWINFLWSAGGEVVERRADGTYIATFNSPGGVAALEFYRKLLLGPWKDESGKEWKGVATRSSTRRQDIMAGKIGMWFAYQSDDIANMNQYDLNPSLLGIAAMPKGPTGKTANEINAAMWGINSAVKDPKKLAACWEFLKYMASDEAAEVRVKAYVENGLGQLVNPVELERWGYTEYITAAQKPWIEASKQLFTTGKPEPNGPNMAFIYKLLNDPLDQAILYPNRPAKAILDASVEKINTKLLNYVPPAEMAAKRRNATLIAALIIGVAVFFIARAIRNALRVRTSVRPGANLPSSVHLSAWLFMAPAVLSIALWAYFPLLRGTLMAFQDYKILGGSEWIGLDNFIEAVGQDTFRIGLKNAFLFTVWLLGLGFCLPIILALLLNEIPKGKVFFRILYYLPAVTTSVVVAMLFKQFWDPTPNGLANSLKLFFDPVIPNFLWPDGPQKWLQDPAQAMFAVVVPLVWAGAGPGCIIYLAALQGIPDEMYEAADLDGAGFFTKIWRITIPTLMPLIVINLVGATVGAFKIMEPVLVQTGGGPDNATYTIGLEVWYNAFMYLKFGYATAAAILMGLLLIGLTMYQLRVLQNVRFAGGNR
jgi:ABC-type sugar transport system permease subunit/ABC-type glycerol-3-phosphate transport system substrate-binding protein